jgi:hypothetical protein
MMEAWAVSESRLRARIIHGLPSRERRKRRRFGALGPKADAGIVEHYVEEAGGRRS